jgi:hypothetical protein
LGNFEAQVAAVFEDFKSEAKDYSYGVDRKLDRLERVLVEAGGIVRKLEGDNF